LANGQQSLLGCIRIWELPLADRLIKMRVLLAKAAAACGYCIPVKHSSLEKSYWTAVLRSGYE